MSSRISKQRVNAPIRAVLLEAKRPIPTVLEHHCLSFSALEDLGSLYMTSRGQRAVTTAFLEQARTLVLDADDSFVDSWSTAIMACIRHCTNVRALKGWIPDNSSKAAEFVRRVWLADLVQKSASSLRIFEIETTPTDSLGFALTECTKLESTGSIELTDVPESVKRAVVERFISNCRQLQTIKLSMSQSHELTHRLLTAGFPLKYLTLSFPSNDTLALLSSTPSHRGIESLDLTLQQFDSPQAAFSALSALSSSLLLLPRLSDLTLALSAQQGVQPPNLASIVLYVQQLEELTINTTWCSLAQLPRFHAPKLRVLTATSLDCASLVKMVELYSDLTRVTTFRTAQQAEPELYVLGSALVRRRCRLWGDMQSFNPGACLPIEMCSAVACWMHLRELSLQLPSYTSPLRIVWMLRRLFKLVKASICSLRAVIVGKDSFEPPSGFDGVVVLSQLRQLTIDFACNNLFAHQRFPQLSHLKIQHSTLSSAELILNSSPFLQELLINNSYLQFNHGLCAEQQTLRYVSICASMSAVEAVKLCARCVNLEDLYVEVSGPAPLAFLALAALSWPVLKSCVLNVACAPDSIDASSLLRLLLHAPLLSELELPAFSIQSYTLTATVHDFYQLMPTRRPLRFAYVGDVECELPQHPRGLLPIAERCERPRARALL